MVEAELYRGLDHPTHVLEAPQGGGVARSGKGTGWRLELPASPPSGMEGLGPRILCSHLPFWVIMFNCQNKKYMPFNSLLD